MFVCKNTLIYLHFKKSLFFVDFSIVLWENFCCSMNEFNDVVHTP